MLVAIAGRIFASLCRPNSASGFTANESWDGATQIVRLHGTCRPRSRKTASSVGRRRHSYHNIPAWVQVNSSVLWTVVSGMPFTRTEREYLMNMLDTQTK